MMMSSSWKYSMYSGRVNRPTRCQSTVADFHLLYCDPAGLLSLPVYRHGHLHLLSSDAFSGGGSARDAIQQHTRCLVVGSGEWAKPKSGTVCWKVLGMLGAQVKQTNFTACTTCCLFVIRPIQVSLICTTPPTTGQRLLEGGG